jgi:hypothetical protein
MDFVYACREGDNEELRYSIRSVLSSFPEANIWVAGGRPSWYIGNYIKVDQVSNSHKNQLNNFKAACESQDINDNFILMNDDFFIVNKIDSIEYFYGDLIQDKIDLYYDLVKDNSYVRRLMQTNSRLIKYGIDQPIDYEMHVPFPVDKNKFKTILEENGRFNWRSIYGNLLNVGGTKIQDVKVYKSGPLTEKSFDYKNNKSDFLSSLDESFEKIKPILEKLFPNPTNCEKNN